jgi:hypothetical protein
MGQAQASREGVCMSGAGTPVAGVKGARPSLVSGRPKGTWKVGSLNSTFVKVLTVAGFAIPVGAYLALLAHYQVNAISGDQWDDVALVAQSFGGHFPSWSSLWGLHTDNRIFFPNLIVIALAHTVSFNIEVEEYLSALMLFGAIALLIWAHKRRSPATPLLFYCPVVFVLLTFSQWQNTLWGFQMAWYLVVVAWAASVVLLDWPRLPWPAFIGAILVAVVGSYSSLQGLLIWPVGLVLLYHRRRPSWAFVSWIAAGVVTTALYFQNYHAPSSSPKFALEHPVLVLKFYLFALGDVVGVQMKEGAPANGAVIAFGALILVMAIFVVLRWGIRRDPRSGTPIGIAMIVFGLLFDLLITEGRLLFGLWGASQSRYVTYDVVVLAGIYMTLLSPARARTPAAGRSTTRRSHPALSKVRVLVDRIDRRILLRITLVVMVVQLVFGVHYGIEGARYEHQTYVSAAHLTRNIDHESDMTVVRLYFVESAQWIRQQAEFLRTHHLSLFG